MQAIIKVEAPWVDPYSLMPSGGGRFDGAHKVEDRRV